MNLHGNSQLTGIYEHTHDSIISALVCPQKNIYRLDKQGDKWDDKRSSCRTLYCNTNQNTSNSWNTFLRGECGNLFTSDVLTGSSVCMRLLAQKGNKEFWATHTYTRTHTLKLHLWKHTLQATHIVATHQRKRALVIILSFSHKHTC